MSQVDGALRGKTILVTGATGFIGSRLAHRLAHDEGATVIGTGRSLDKAAHLKPQVRLEQADLGDRASHRALLDGVDVVVHAAAWLPRAGDPESEGVRLNVEGTRALYEDAATAGVRRFVHVSTIAAYGLPQTDRIGEDHPLDARQSNPYGRTKAQGELALLEVDGPPLAIVRPAMVYGPGSDGWTKNMAHLVRSGTPVIFGKGTGLAFPIYVDNLVDLLVRATASDATGAFNASDGSIDWRGFFAYVERWTGKTARRLPLPLAYALAQANVWFKLGLPVDRDRISMTQRPLVYATDRAEQELGWRPRIGLDVGMEASEAWLREIGFLEARP
jgi:nucleoside-diphosphate-sugar epimerase